MIVTKFRESPPPMDLKIETNAIEARHFIDSLSRRQLPFGISRAINGMAYDVRDEEQGKIGNYMELRTDWLRKKGAMPVVPSKKSQFPNIFAILGVKDDVAALAAIGGTKKARSGAMGVPFSNAGDGKGTRDILNPGTKTLGPTKWPGRIARKGKPAKRKRKRNGSGQVLLNNEPKPFLLQGKSGRNFVAKRAAKDDPSLEILYELKGGVDIPKLWPLVDNVESFVAHNYDRYLDRALRDAVAKAK